MTVTASPAASGARTQQQLRTEDPRVLGVEPEPPSPAPATIPRRHLASPSHSCRERQRHPVAKMGFEFSVSQLFLLVAVPTWSARCCGCRWPRGPAHGRDWTMVARLCLLLVPTLLFATAVQDPDTPYWAFVLISATAGRRRATSASRIMANVPSFFYRQALDLNAAGGATSVWPSSAACRCGRRRRPLRARSPPAAAGVGCDGRLLYAALGRGGRRHGILAHGRPAIRAHSDASNVAAL